MLIKNIHIIIVIAFSAFFSTNLVAQNFTLKGKIVDTKMQPVEYLYINLLKNDTLLITTTATDSLGLFNIQAPQGTYIISIEQFGENYFHQQVQLGDNLDLGQIIIKEKNFQLDEVKITMRKKLIERKVDRLVFNVENSLTSNGGDGIDILRNSPSVRVSNENISIIGKSGVHIMINNKLVSLSGNDLINYLKSIKAEEISKIEIITTPPANFDAEGNSGLINILLKTIPKDIGFSGSIHGSYTQSKYTSGSIGASLNYKNNKIQILSALTVGDGKSGPTLGNTFYYPEEKWETQSNRKDYYKYLSGRLGVEYTVNTKNRIGFQYLINLSEWNIDANENTYIQRQSNNFRLNTISRSESSGSSHSINTNFKHTFDTLGRELIVDLDYLNYDNNWERRFLTLQADSVSGQRNFSDLGIDIYSGKIHFNLPFSFGTIEAGGKASFTKNNSYIKLSPFTNNPSDATLPFEDNDFLYKENIQAIYTSFSRFIGERIEIKAGLRIENTQISFETNETHTNDRNSYTKLFPTFYLTYKLDEAKTNFLSLNYSRRIGRPNYIHLNPFRWYSNPYAYTEGNPALQPSFTDNIELSHTYGTLISSIYLSRINSGFGQVTITPIGTINQITRSENYYNGTQVGWSESFSFNPTAFWESYNQGFVYYSDTKAVIQGIHPSQSGFGAYLSTNNKFSINKNKTIALELNYWYQFPESFGLTSTNGYGQCDLGFNLKFLENKFTITGSVTDLFRTSKPKFTSYSNGVKQIYANYFDIQQFRIGLSYNFGGSKIKGHQRDTSNEEERKRTTI